MVQQSNAAGQPMSPYYQNQNMGGAYFPLAGAGYSGGHFPTIGAQPQPYAGGGGFMMGQPPTGGFAQFGPNYNPMLPGAPPGGMPVPPSGVPGADGGYGQIQSGLDVDPNQAIGYTSVPTGYTFSNLNPIAALAEATGLDPTPSDWGTQAYEAGVLPGASVGATPYALPTDAERARLEEYQGQIEEWLQDPDELRPVYEQMLQEQMRHIDEERQSTLDATKGMLVSSGLGTSGAFASDIAGVSEMAMDAKVKAQNANDTALMDAIEKWGAMGAEYRGRVNDDFADIETAERNYIEGNKQAIDAAMTDIINLTNYGMPELYRMNDQFNSDMEMMWNDLRARNVNADEARSLLSALARRWKDSGFAWESVSKGKYYYYGTGGRKGKAFANAFGQSMYY